MKYKDFDGYKINESKIMDSTMFGDFELSSEEKCEYPVFKMFPKHTFVMVLKSGRCYTYSKEGKREKIWDVETLEKNEARELSTFSIIGTENGQFIKEQYEKMSNLEVVDIIQYIKKDKEDKEDNPKRRKIPKNQLFQGTLNKIEDILENPGKMDLGKDEDEDDTIMGNHFRNDS